MAGKSVKRETWTRIQRENPKMAEFMLDMRKHFGKVELGGLRLGLETVVEFGEGGSDEPGVAEMAERAAAGEPPKVGMGSGDAPESGSEGAGAMVAGPDVTCETCRNRSKVFRKRVPDGPELWRCDYWTKLHPDLPTCWVPVGERMDCEGYEHDHNRD